MKLQIYAIYDDAAKAFANPFFMHNDGMAIRAFQDNVNDESSQINKHADQFGLFRIGEYDDQTGDLAKYDPPKSLGMALAFKNPDQAASELSQLTAALESLRTAQEKHEKNIAEMFSTLIGG